MTTINPILHATILDGAIPKDDEQHQGHIAGPMHCSEGWVEAHVFWGNHSRWKNSEESFRIRYFYGSPDLRHNDRVEFRVIRAPPEVDCPQPWVSFDLIERQETRTTVIYRQESK